MWTEKLSAGVLRILTPLGPRYLKPSISQRVYLLWVFRHFEKLPLEVLSRRQQRLISNLYAAQRFRSEEHTSELQSQSNLVCRLLLEKKNTHLCVARVYSGKILIFGPALIP